MTLPFPTTGKSKDEVLAAMRAARDHDVQWQKGRAFSLVYHAGKDVDDLLKEASLLFFSENGLNPAAFPSLQKFETEITSMAASLLGGDDNTAGTVTSGGTESLLMAVKTARDWARKNRPEIKQPEMILPTTGHPAFEKAAEYFGVKAVRIPVRADYRADVESARKAVTAWLSILESSYILYRLQPFHRNFNKRLVKSSKLYFYDTGIACSLLGIHDENQVNLHYMKGALFENLIINEFIKHNFNRGEYRPPYFWQDSRGKEIDCLLVDGEKIVPIEIKSGKTISNSYFDNLKYWRQLTAAPKEQGYVVYGGDQSLQTSTGSFVSWRELNRIPS